MFESEYKESRYQFPSHDIDPEIKKTKGYCMAFAKAFYSRYLMGELYSTPIKRDKYYELRKYAIGDQPEDIYYELCYGKDKSGNIIRKGWMNVDWRILKIAVKVGNAYLGLFNNIDFDISCESHAEFIKKEEWEKE